MRKEELEISIVRKIKEEVHSHGLFAFDDFLLSVDGFLVYCLEDFYHKFLTKVIFFPLKNHFAKDFMPTGVL